MEFDVWYVGPDGEDKHALVEANYMSEAVEHIEAFKGGEVYRTEKHSNTRARMFAEQ